MTKTQRLRDPVHGLIVFDGQNETDQAAWRLLNTVEFQRLRRVRQLGFSDLVYPGATHSRFAHSIGVYHTARRLAGIIRRKIDSPDEERERVALLAALLHDVGHGPFSHTFEAATRAIGKGRRHEEWSAEIIRGDTEINAVLREVDTTLPEDVAKLLLEDETKDIYATIVSSQFDADRLDYLQRDRYMTGVEFGHVDRDWLLDCIEVGTVTMGPSDDPVEAPCLYLSPKGFHVAEEYLEARYRLYQFVYMHKTTRSAEIMLGKLFRCIADLVTNSSAASTRNWLQGRIASHFAAEKPTMESYLRLDDSVVWAELSELATADNPEISSLAQRLRDRNLYKCFDLGSRLASGRDDNLRLRFVRQLKDSSDAPDGLFERSSVDSANVAIYKWYDFEDSSALNKVLVKLNTTDVEPVDIGSRSSVLKALRDEQKIHRFYVPSSDDIEFLEKIWREVQ